VILPSASLSTLQSKSMLLIWLRSIQQIHDAYINQNKELHVKEYFEPSIKALVRNTVPELPKLDLVDRTSLNPSLPSKSIKKHLCICLRLFIQSYNWIRRNT